MSQRTVLIQMWCGLLLTAGLVVMPAAAGPGGGGGGGRGGRGGLGGAVAALPPGKPVTPTTHPATLPAGMEDFKTTETAKTTTIQRGRANANGVDEPGYLGVDLNTDKGKLVVAAVAPDSPAAKAGMAVGDIMISVDGHDPADEQEFRDLIHSTTPGTLVHFVLMRGSKQMNPAALITAVSRPLSLAGTTGRGYLGVGVTDAADGARITLVDNGSPAAQARLQVGDVIVKVDDVALGDGVHLTDVLATRQAGDTVNLVAQRNQQQSNFKIQLGAEPAAGRGGRGGFGGGAGGAAAAGGTSTYFDRLGQVWRKDTLKLALVGIEFLDMKRTPAITNKSWEDAFFSHGTYKLTATGQPAYGSEYDYYFEQSYGQLKIDGKMLPWVTVTKNRADYSQGTGTGQDRVLLGEVTDLLAARDGASALNDYDGIIFIYAGPRAVTTRGSIFWPHKSTLTLGQRRVPYVIIPEGAQRMTDISVACHESGHILGLPDLYARPEDPGAEGLGVWCVMSQQAGNGRPQQMCAWCKEQLGWIKPTIIDPTVKQKLVLGPIEDSPKECYKVLVKPDGSEYFLLENRQQKGFDASIPAEGLLIWRVEGNKPLLEASTGIDGPQAPQAFLQQIPFPSVANDSFTPFTTPSSRSKLGGGTPVYITNIKRMSDGRISFWMGYQFG